MEAAIRRGRLLREILKQERLAPLPVEFQIAWLIAFNDGLFEGVEPEAIPALLAGLEVQVKGSGLSLDSPREEWRAALGDWLGINL